VRWPELHAILQSAGLSKLSRNGRKLNTG
jgi:hypothetical protein